MDPASTRTEGGGWSRRVTRLVSWESAAVPSETQQIKDVEGSLDPLVGYLGYCCQILELFLPLGREKSQRISLRNVGPGSVQGPRSEGEKGGHLFEGLGKREPVQREDPLEVSWRPPRI